MDRIIFRNPIRTECRVAFPYLYNALPRSVHISWHSHPPIAYLRPETQDLPAFYFDSGINPISSRAVAPKNVTASHEDELFGPNSNEEPEDEEFELPATMEPFFSDEEL